MRLIDADALCKECIEEFILETCEGCVVKEYKLHKAIDAVPVVRCKDCKWGKAWKNGFGVEGFKCDMLCVDLSPEAFCFYGERKDGDG